MMRVVAADKGGMVFNRLCHPSHKQACGMDDILRKLGLLGDSESPNNSLLSNPKTASIAGWRIREWRWSQDNIVGTN